MKQSVVKELATPELIDKIDEQENMLEKLILNHAVATIENPMKIRYTRKAIARLKTELNKRNREEAAGKDDSGKAEKKADKKE